MIQAIIYFVRHGETDWNVSQRIQGQEDTDINERGRVQADRNGDILRSLIGKAEDFDFVASPLKRTRQTMERIRIRMNLDPHDFRIDKQLMEVNFGDWQGHMIEEIAKEREDLVEIRARDKWNFIPPGKGSESYMILSERIAHWLKSVRQPTVCVTHGGCLRALFYLVEGMQGYDAANLPILQDRILRLENEKLTWL